MRSRIYVVAMAAMVIVLGLLAGCGPAQAAQPAADVAEPEVKEMVLKAEDNGREIQVTQGQTLVVSLESNPSTGYGWEVEGSTEPILKQIGEAEFEPQSNLIGAAGVQTLRFEVTGSGEMALKLIYHRPWEKGVEPLQTFSVQVVAR